MNTRRRLWPGQGWRASPPSVPLSTPARIWADTRQGFG
jgi:hypothetical protein